MHEGGAGTMSFEIAVSERRKRSPWEVQRAVLFALLLREMKARVGGQWVGAVWTLFEPLAHMLILVTVLDFMRGIVSATAEYPVFLVTGLIPFFLFQNLVMRLMDGIEANRGLFSYRQVKPIDTLASRAAVEGLMNLLVYASTLALLGWLGFHVMPARPLEMLGVNMLLILFGASLGLLTAVLSYDRPRLRSFIRMAFLPLYFASGTIFSLDMLPSRYIDILLWNPVLHLIALSRYSFIVDYVPLPGVNVLYPLLWMLSCLALGLSLYRAKRQQLLSSS
jgi:capsular polysaccharide transport system permease protein